MSITIYHNPACGTSRNVLEILRLRAEDVVVIEYLKTPPTREILKSLVAKMRVSLRDIIRQKGTPYEELGLGNPSLSDEQILDAMIQHPILINHPIVVTATAAKLCRPSETVLELLVR